MKVGFVKDAFRGMPHVMATISNNEIQVKSITEFGKSIISETSFRANDIANTIPAGFVFTGFSEKSVVLDSETKIAAVDTPVFSYSGSVSNVVSNQKLRASSLSLSKFAKPHAKINAVAFKAGAFKNSSKKSELLRKIASGKVIFNDSLGKVLVNSKNPLGHIEYDLIKSSFSDSFIRKTVEKTFTFTTSRRAARRAKALLGDRSPRTATGEPLMARVSVARKQIRHGR